MKEEIKMKENVKMEPSGTMPQVGAMQHMSAAPGVSPVQSAPNVQPAQYPQDTMPVQPGPAGVMPYMMNQMPLICCPYLMNMQCPMIYGNYAMGMNMMNNPAYAGVSPISANLGSPVPAYAGPVLGAANNSAYSLPGIGAMPSMNNQYFPMGGINY